MIRFNNDYNQAAHPNVLNKLVEISNYTYSGYGTDSICEQAKEIIKSRVGRQDVDVHFLVGGTQTNATVISSALRPYESVVCSEAGHILVNETGAIEHVGHKIIYSPSKEGLIDIQFVKSLLNKAYTCDGPEHKTIPKMVYISFPSEYGTINSKDELTELSQICHKYGTYLFLDGARLPYGLAASKDITIEDISNLCDVFYIGGTKCGALFGEAVIICNNELKPHFRNSIKQNGGLLAKGWLLGAQFLALFDKNDTYFKIGVEANKKSDLIRKALNDKNVSEYIHSDTNQTYALFTPFQFEKLSKKYIFEKEFVNEDGRICARICTSWSTKDEDMYQLIEDIEAF